MKKLLLLLFIFCSLSSNAQDNFTYSPLQPKAGDLITITYTPAGNLAETKLTIEAAVYTFSQKKQTADDINLKKLNNGYTGSVQTDTSASLVYFSFAADGKFDNNHDNGYWIQLYEDGKIKSGANTGLASLYNGMGQSVGITPDNKKALNAYYEEFKLHPESKQKDILLGYYQTYALANKDDAAAMIQTGIESLLKSGLKDESDYNLLQNLYELAKLPQQANLINDLTKEKFPDGKWAALDAINHYLLENDISKKETMLSKIISQINTNLKWKEYDESMPYFKSVMANSYTAKEDWNGMKNAIKEYGISGAELASLYNSAAWDLQEKDKNLKEAEDMSKIATDWAKKEWENPGGKKPDWQTTSQWKKSLARNYAMYADTYAMINYKLGNFKKGFPYVEDAAIKISRGNDADFNAAYALLAEKVLSPRIYIPQFEQFVKDGKGNASVKEVLKKKYTAKKGEAAADAYISQLEKASYLKIVEELRKEMLNDASPAFTLLDLQGEKVNIADLKNKVVVVDFWATWCGPCKASFPGMQKMVTKFKDDKDVKFVFIDTWENGEDNNKKHADVSDFIAENKYDFHVLMDNDSKVVSDFKVEGIPTKFVIDKKGIVRFKSVGFDGSDDKLVTELTIMINMAKGM